MTVQTEIYNVYITILTHWGRVTHICVSKLTIIDSDNGLSPDRRQAIIWTNAGILLIGPLGTNFSEIFVEILAFSFKKMHLKVSSVKRRPFCLGLNVLRIRPHEYVILTHLQLQYGKFRISLDFRDVIYGQSNLKWKRYVANTRQLKLAYVIYLDQSVPWQKTHLNASFKSVCLAL